MDKAKQIFATLNDLFINRLMASQMRFKSKYLKMNVYLIFLLHFWVSNSWSQAYNFNYLSIQNGLPQSQAFAICFDDDQYAWIGTQGGGVCRFDGQSFLYLTKNDSLISNRIYVIKFLENKLWIGQKGGVTVYSKSGEFVHNYRFNNPNLLVRDLVFFEGIYLVATNEGIYQLNDDIWEENNANPTLRGLNAQSFFIAGDTALWICSDQGLLSYTNAFGRLSRAKGLSSSQVECAVEFQGEWVIGTYGGGVNFYNKTSIYKLPVFDQISDDIILSLFVADDQELWIGTMNDGLYVYNQEEESLKNYTTRNGLSGNHVKLMTADFWGNIWIGTSGGGVSIFQNSPFIEYNSSSGLNGDYVFSVLNDKQDNLWLGTEGMGVMRINDTSKVLFDEEYGFASAKVKGIFEDRDGDIWFGTEGRGLGIYSKGLLKDTIIAYQNQNGLKGNWIKCFAQDPVSGHIYIGTNDAGIFTLDKRDAFPLQQSFKSLKVTNGFAPIDITSLTFYQGNLWYAGDDGHYGYIQKNGELVDFYEEGRSFRNIVCEGDYVWMGSKDDGLLILMLDGDSIVSKEWLTTNNSRFIKSNNIYQLLYYNRQLWVGTERGLDRLDFDSLFQITGAEHFGFEEGFEGVETNINASHVDQNGNLWFGTVDGLFVYKGRDLKSTPRKQPVLHINDFQIVFESIEKTPYASVFDQGEFIKELVLPYDKNHISIRFQAIQYSYTKNIRYRWKLEGVDPHWAPPSAINVATYPNLTPGDYTFLVQASIDDNWEAEPLKLSFKIDQPYWEKFWFKFAYYALAFILLLSVVGMILLRQRRKSKAFNEKLILEKNLLELEQKALRLQMNPHFIFNVLNSIHNLIILNDSDKARYALSKFSKLMRQVLENSREKFISIDEEVETLQNYVQLERLTSNVSIELIFEFDEELDTAEQILPPLIIQPFVENAIIHGLKGIDRAGEIKISFRWFNENVLECVIEDNGKGIFKAGEMKAQQSAQHKSTALKVVQERLANLNQKSTFIPFEMIDLKDDSGNAFGTKVILRILV
jgi:ligand-binding sensor domain-containing protein